MINSNRHSIVQPLDLWALQDDHNLTTDIRLEYAWGPGVETLRILESAAKLIPIPFLKDLINLALTVLLACEVSQFLFMLHFIIIDFY